MTTVTIEIKLLSLSCASLVVVTLETADLLGGVDAAKNSPAMAFVGVSAGLAASLIYFKLARPNLNTAWPVATGRVRACPSVRKWKPPTTPR